MFYIEDDAIYITRGDDAAINIDIINNNEAYEMQEGDTLTLTVRKYPSEDSEIILQLHNDTTTGRFDFTAANTAAIEPGRYSADIQLVMADGLTRTIWPQLKGSQRYKITNWGNFVIMPEVTF